MPGTNITMFASSTGGAQNGLAQIDIPQTGNITGVHWSIVGTLNATEEVLQVQVSFGSTGVFSSNDQRAIISECSLQAGVLTAVGAVCEYENVNHVMLLPVSMGERIFMHANATAGVIGQLTAILSFDFDLDRPLARRR